jgi:thiol-disulfide isomerase/thioredoxin
MGASLADLAGHMQPLAQWRGKILVVNFWATWCAPCREEIPALIEVQEELATKGAQIVGIAIDQPDKVRPYAAEMRINYPILVGELDAMELTRAAGNAVGGLPFTVIVDRRGDIAGTVSGRVTAEKLRAMLGPLL